jgi:collagenase-like PrtC family protease
MAMSTGRIELTLGPLLFNWPAERLRAYYAEVAEVAAIDRVYLGEVVCGKRAPLVDDVLAQAAERLRAAGKQVVWSGQALPSTPREMRVGARQLATGELVELNDVSGLTQLPAGAPFVAGPFLNIYNEAAAAELIRRGCRRLCPNIELPLSSVATIAAACPGLEIELFAYGRLPLALSGRCYHARLHGLRKDTCQFVCDRDPDGLAVNTVEGEPFLAVNGVQTLSYGTHLADAPLETLRAAGVGALRLSPHTGDLGAIVAAFRRFADGDIDRDGLRTAVEAAHPPGPLVNGYVHGVAGIRQVAET